MYCSHTVYTFASSNSVNTLYIIKMNFTASVKLRSVPNFTVEIIRIKFQASA